MTVNTIQDRSELMEDNNRIYFYVTKKKQIKFETHLQLSLSVKNPRTKKKKTKIQQTKIHIKS